MKQYEFMKDIDEDGNESVSVTNKPRRRLDLLPRLVCLFIALIIWIWMVNINDTDVTDTIVVKVDIVGLDALEQSGMMIYGIKDNSEIAVTIKGTNRDIRKYAETEYKAVVDVSGISEVGDFTRPLTLSMPTDSNVTLESVLPDFTFKVDFKVTKVIPFDVVVSNAQESGTMKYSYESSYEMNGEIKEGIEISGPKTAVDLIFSGRFNVDGSFALTRDDKDFSDFQLTFLDKNLSEVKVDDGIIKYSTADIDVNVKAIGHKNVPLRIDTAKGIIAKSGTNTVEIWGAPSIIRGINEHYIDMRDQKVGNNIPVELTSDSFPEGVYVKEDLKITISFEAERVDD